MRETLVIDDVETLRAFAEPTRVAIMELLDEPRSARQLAAALEVPRTRLYHHLELLQSRGLIEQVDERRSRGLTERVFRLTAANYTVSAELLNGGAPADRLDALTTLFFDAPKADLLRSVASGQARLDPAEGPQQLDLGRTIANIAPEQAEAFIEEFRALVARFDAAHERSADTRPYALVWALYPSSSVIE